jgi:competence protein ComGC
MHEELVNEFYPFAKQHLGFNKDPKINFIEDGENAQNPMGYTGHYDPSTMVITIYITGRHPKDILRSLSHELVHHAQNCRGEDLMIKTHDIDADPHLKAMEDEAFHIGSGRLMKRFQKQMGGYPMSEDSKPDYLDLDKDGDKEEPMKKAAKEAEEDKEEKETQTESKDYHTKKNFMLHDMLLRKFGIKKGDK